MCERERACELFRASHHIFFRCIFVCFCSRFITVVCVRVCVCADVVASTATSTMAEIKQNE